MYFNKLRCATKKKKKKVWDPYLLSRVKTEAKGTLQDPDSETAAMKQPWTTRLGWKKPLQQGDMYKGDLHTSKCLGMSNIKKPMTHFHRQDNY